MNDLVSELTTLGGSAEPARLMTALGLDESRVDEFYDAIRAAVRSGAIEEVRTAAPAASMLKVV